MVEYSSYIHIYTSKKVEHCLNSFLEKSEAFPEITYFVTFMKIDITLTIYSKF